MTRSPLVRALVLVWRVSDTLTVMGLGLPAALARTLNTTNPIENLIGRARDVARRVKRWRGGKMILRWTAAATTEAGKGFRRLKGHRGLPKPARIPAGCAACTIHSRSCPACRARIVQDTSMRGRPAVCHSALPSAEEQSCSAVDDDGFDPPIGPADRPRRAHSDAHREKPLNRTLLNLAIDLTAAALFAGLLATGYVLGIAMPAGTSRSLTLWGLGRDRWGDIHFWISLTFLATIVLHLSLHWRWAVATIGRRLGVDNPDPAGSALAAGLAAAAAAGLFAWATSAGTRETAEPAEEGVRPGPATGGAAPAPAPGGAGPAGAAGLWSEVAPVFRRSCLGCHGPGRARGGFRVDRREDFFTGKDGPRVVAGDAARSPLIGIVSGMRPDLADPDIHTLPGREVELLRKWVDQGAPPGQ